MKWTKSNVPDYIEVNEGGDSRVEIISTFIYSDIDGYIGQTHEIIIDNIAVEKIIFDDTNSEDSFCAKQVWNNWVQNLED